MKLTKYKNAEGKTMSIEEIVILLLLVALAIWVMLWASGLGTQAMRLIKEFF